MVSGGYLDLLFSFKFLDFWGLVKVVVVWEKLFVFIFEGGEFWLVCEDVWVFVFRDFFFLFDGVKLGFVGEFFFF